MHKLLGKEVAGICRHMCISVDRKTHPGACPAAYCKPDILASSAVGQAALGLWRSGVLQPAHARGWYRKLLWIGGPVWVESNTNICCWTALLPNASRFVSSQHLANRTACRSSQSLVPCDYQVRRIGEPSCTRPFPTVRTLLMLARFRTVLCILGPAYETLFLICIPLSEM